MSNLEAELVTNYTADDIACPICGQPAINQFFFETGEEYIDCHSCGYTRKFYITNLEQKEAQSEYDWIPEYKIDEQQGYGAYAVRYFGSSNLECGGFATPESEQYFIDTVEANKSNISYARYTKLVDGKIEQVILINSPDIL